MTRKQRYYSYLKSDHWRLLRMRKLKLVKYSCFRCGHKSMSNHAHHLRYKNLFDVQLDDLTILCAGCHSKVHKGKDKKKRFKKKRHRLPRDPEWEITKAECLILAKCPWA